MEGQYLEMGTIYTFSLNGRSMFLFEGTATGPFDVEDVWYEGHSDSRPYFDVTEDMIDPETGEFSVLLPYPPSGHVCFGNASPRTGAQATLQGPEINNYALKTITRLPDWLWRQSPHNRSYMFSGCVALEYITADMSFTHTLTSFVGFFQDCSVLKEFPQIYTENATTMYSMFAYCTQIETIPCELDTRKVTTMENMFNRCTNLKSIPELDTPALTRTTGMFYECRNLVDVPLFNTSRCTNMARMFYNCQKLPAIPAFDTGNNTDFSSMFYQCYQLTDYQTLDTKNGTNFDRIFFSCGKIPEIKFTDTSKGTSFERAFNGCNTLTTLPDNLDFSSAVSLYGMASACGNLVSVPSYSFPVGTGFAVMYGDCKNLQTVGVMDTPKATSFYQTFYQCLKLQESPLRNTSTATSFYQTFRGAGSQVAGGLIWHDIDMSKATTIEGIFYAGYVKELPYLNTEKVSLLWYDNYGGRGYVTTAGTVSFGGLDCTNLKAGQYYLATANVENHGPLTNMKENVNLSPATKLTHDSLVTIINSLADITATATENPKTLKLGATNAAKLTAEEIAVAEAKGWTVITTD